MRRSVIRHALALLIAMAGPVAAQDRPALERQFRGWLEQVVWPRAAEKGVTRQTFADAFDGVTLNWELPDLIPPGSPAVPQRQDQSEFAAPGRYFSQGGVDSAASTGRAMARRHAEALAETTAGTGVPGHIILAIWGRESGYGRAAIPHDVFAVLGTKGFIGRRADYFTDELIAALQIAQAGHVRTGALKSSWAGAMGQPQFMPSSYLAYGSDGDGDGQADIWTSEADTIASIGAFLAAHGWDAGRDWGFEVVVPDTIPCSLEGPDQGRPIAQWEAMGIARVADRPFPAQERDGTGFLLMPAGRHGPAFIVTPNFSVLKDYNKSDLYALFVGHVGDRIAYGAGDFGGRWQDTGRMMRSDVADLQRVLEDLGHDVGGVDGLAGFKTRRSIGRWQAATGQPQTCFPTADMVIAPAP